MRNTLLLHRPLTLNFLAISYFAGLSVCSYLIWVESIDKQPTPLGAGLQLAAIALVVTWSHFLVRLFRKISRREVSVACCAMLFFGVWTVFFLIYNCLV